MLLKKALIWQYIFCISNEFSLDATYFPDRRVIIIVHFNSKKIVFECWIVLIIKVEQIHYSVSTLIRGQESCPSLSMSEKISSHDQIWPQGVILGGWVGGGGMRSNTNTLDVSKTWPCQSIPIPYLIIISIVVRVFLIVIDGVSGESVSTLVKLDDTVSNIWASKAIKIVSVFRHSS